MGFIDIVGIVLVINFILFGAFLIMLYFTPDEPDETSELEDKIRRLGMRIDILERRIDTRSYTGLSYTIERKRLDELYDKVDCLKTTVQDKDLIQKEWDKTALTKRYTKGLAELEGDQNDK